MSENGPRRLLAAVLIRAAKDALDANDVLASEARAWLRAVGGDLAAWLDIPSERLVAWLVALPPLAHEQLTRVEARQVG